MPSECLTATVVVVTLNRPDCVRRCLACLYDQQPQPLQVIVVDASSDDCTRDVVREVADVEYIRTDVGYGHMTKSRNLALARAVGDIVAFVDDDAFAHPGWLLALLQPYADSSVGAVGGRALNHQPGEESNGADKIGRLQRNGMLTGNFAANPGRVIPVDHIIGCNMSFRREILAKLGGLREDYPGTEVREETDIALRVKALGHHVVFTPFAVVDHIGAPQVKGRRFDSRYVFYSAQNHIILLIRNFGFFSPLVWRFLLALSVAATVDAARRIGGGISRVVATGAGVICGVVRGVFVLFRAGRDPIRRGAMGQKIRADSRRVPSGTE